MSETATARTVLVRTEVEVAAEAIMALFAHGVMGATGPEMLVRLTEVTGIPVSEFRAAWQRNNRAGYRPPSWRVAASPLTDDPPPPSRVTNANKARWARKNPGPGIRVCSICGAIKEAEEFGIKDRRTGTLKSACKPCLRAYQRARYNAAVGTGFLISLARAKLEAGSPFVGDACQGCGEALAVGDEVEAADVELRHCRCGGER